MRSPVTLLNNENKIAIGIYMYLVVLTNELHLYVVNNTDIMCVFCIKHGERSDFVTHIPYHVYKILIRR